jgi:hypothetical protein
MIFIYIMCSHVYEQEQERGEYNMVGEKQYLCFKSVWSYRKYQFNLIATKMQSNVW